jgi:mRNA-degrading endonuclease RelE of RelBE toxin-antitoxin system
LKASLEVLSEPDLVAQIRKSERFYGGGGRGLSFEGVRGAARRAENATPLSGPFRLDIPPHVAERIRTLPPEVKQSVKHALRLLSSYPAAGEPLRGQLEGYWRYRVRRYRVVYRPMRRAIRILAIGHRRAIYEGVGDRIRSQVS